MPSTHMTNADREAIRDAMIEARFGPLEAQHKQDRKPSVPAVLLFDLNQKLGLPPASEPEDVAA